MKQEQRLILVFLLTIGIMMAWTSFFPPPEPPVSSKPAEQSEAKDRVAQQQVSDSVLSPAESDSIKQIKLSPFLLEVGEKFGGIQTITTHGEPLLMRSSPGLLQTEVFESGRSARAEFQTESRQGVLIGTGKVDGWSIIRKMVPSEKSEYLFQGEITLLNSSDQTKQGGLRLVAFKNLELVSSHDQQYRHGFLWMNGERVHLNSVRLKPGETKQFQPAPVWVSAQNRHGIVIFRPKFSGGMFHVEHPTGKFDEKSTGWIDFPETELAPGQAVSWKFDFYAGPADPIYLAKIDLGGILSFGKFTAIVEMISRFMNWTYGFTKNWGLSVILLSLVAWLPLAPMSWYSMKNATDMQAKMALIRPEMARLEKQYKNNPQKKSQETMKLWKKHNISPASGCLGCLPMLITFPIYPALYLFLNRSTQIQGASFLWIKDLAAPDALLRFSQPLPLIGDSFNLLPILATAAMFMQMTLQQKMMPQPAAADMSEEQQMQQKMQKMMFKFIPLMLLFSLYSAPAGFMLYFALYSTFLSGQQILIGKLKSRN
ncbi:MAG: hypothetical protein COV76_03260 [Candidatus Omnitrophica bacterium CG11_big_fil_rev_8_21_14_0_20_64_10]|nr:MAG: hypothetical protein COV76_03260 [Candidatus Omnitrophica bacterium CG11_big_fil_rev_8_21_14_0_20_64_10]